MAMAGCRLWFWLQGMVLATEYGSGHRVWFWPQGVVLATDFNFVNNSFFLILSLNISYIIYILIYIVFRS
jgi:hypothetical protein